MRATGGIFLILSCVLVTTACGGHGSSGGPDAGGGGGGGGGGDAAVDAAPPDGPVQVTGADPTFGNGGVVTVGFPGGIAAIMRVARQSDGKIVGVGGTEESIVIARVTADGVFDSTFGTDGIVQLPWGVATNGVQVGYGCAIQPDGKIVIAARVLATYDALAGKEVVARLLPDGSFDTSFAQTGYVIGPRYTAATSLALDASGNLVVGGAGRLERYLPDGSLDPTFGTNGVANSGVSAVDLALQPDGKIVAVGGKEIARFTSAGAADTSFGTSGKVTITAGQVYDQLFSVAVQADGKIVVGGAMTLNSTYQNFWIGRYTSDGAVDTTFATTGSVTGDSGASGVTYGVGIDPSGKIVGSGAATFGGIYGGSARFDAAGVLDTTFGNQGLGSGFSPAAFSNVVFAPDGSFTFGGTAIDQGSFSYELAFGRDTASGGGDATFGSGGMVKHPIGGSFDRAHAVAFQADGKLLVGGWAFAGGGAAVVRLAHDGSLDTSFANNGKLTGSRNLLYVNALAVQPSGKILVGGVSGYGGSPRQFVVERYDATGALDPSFGTAGVAKGSPISGETAEAINMTVAPDGTIVLVGETLTAAGSTEYGVFELTADGAPNTAFGTNGGAASAFGGTTGIGTHAIVQADGGVVVLGVAGGHPTLVRFTATGALDTTFGNVALPGTPTSPFGLAQQPDGKLVAVVGDYSTGALEIVRYTAAGVLDPSFGTGGVVTESFGGNDYYGLYSFMGLVVLPDGSLEVGLAEASSDTLTEHGVLLRLNPDGSADDSFGAAGIDTLALGPGSTSINALALDPDGKLVAVGRTWTWQGGSDFLAVRFNP